MVIVRVKGLSLVKDDPQASMTGDKSLAETETSHVGARSKYLP